MHTVKDLMDWLNQENLIIDTDMQSSLAAGITGVTDNSKVADKNMAFFCKGAHFKIEYLQQAIQSGVCSYITDKVELVQFNHYILVSDIRRTMAIVANNFYGKAWKKLKLIGITGTKGKSTTAYMVKSIIDDYLKPTDKKCGILSSIENYDGQITEESHLTTLEPLGLHKMFYNMVQNGCSYCVMEVSSQALKYDRVYGITFDMGCFLNIGEDHISPVEHSSFEDYFNSKLRIIDQSKKTILFDQIQMPSHKNNSVVFFGKNPDSYYRVSNVVFGEEANSFDIDQVGSLQIQMRGDFNILNASAASAITHELKIPYNNIQKGLLRAAASGRMELFYGEKHLAIVDYAHNKLSYEALFNSINKEYKGFKVITIFGCPGGKAYKRRAELPQIAEKYSDYIYVTEEDHGEEDLLKICQEIFNNLTNPLKAEIQMDREVAISDAFNKFEEKTLVLVLGKGRETRQKRGTDYIDTKSDVEMVKTYIR